MRTWTFAKGHATLNDYLVVVDRHGMLAPSAEDVLYLCDRRRGLGADGLLRAIRAEHMPQWQADGAVWFMDSRNADGSESHVTGNGLRVFVRFLAEEGLIGTPEAVIATRSGPRHVVLLPDGRIATSMGTLTFDDALSASGVTSEITLDDRIMQATAVRIGNGVHAVCEQPSSLGVTFDNVRVPHTVTNVEVYALTGEGQLTLRQWERRVGETVSCGTGAVAAVATWLRRQNRHSGVADVLVRGGRLCVEVAETECGQTGTLIGPAVIVARGDVVLPDAPTSLPSA